ncbi:MAG: hypothetical protein ACTSPB_08590 [Candidatus Thorarchaeota archaeon]
MGTSGSYGGSPGWNNTRKETEDWLESVNASSDNHDEPSQPDDTNFLQDDQTNTPSDHSDETSEVKPGEINQEIARIFFSTTNNLLSSMTHVSAGGMASQQGIGSGASRGVRGGRGGRAKAAKSGGIAIAGAHGLQTRNSEVLDDLGLDLEELEGLSPFDQARLIVDLASETSALLEDDEIRKVNAEFVLWALQQEGEITASDLLKFWITEWVYQTWLTEAGSVLRDGRRNGSELRALELEARATLEAATTRIEFSADGVSASDFENAILKYLDILKQVFKEVVA